jgi:hypothetical protein
VAEKHFSGRTDMTLAAHGELNKVINLEGSASISFAVKNLEFLVNSGDKRLDDLMPEQMVIVVNNIYNKCYPNNTKDSAMDKAKNVGGIILLLIAILRFITGVDTLQEYHDALLAVYRYIIDYFR